MQPSRDARPLLHRNAILHGYAIVCRSGLVLRKEGKALPCGLQVFFTLNHAAYNAGRNNRVNTVATINPPMIATAIGP